MEIVSDTGGPALARMVAVASGARMMAFCAAEISTVKVSSGSACVSVMIGIETIAAITSSNVAKQYNIVGKGEITPGFDADLVVIDPELERTIEPSELHSYADYSPYEGMTTKGWPVMTILRGTVIVEDGEFTGEAGQGSFLQRRPSPSAT